MPSELDDDVLTSGGSGYSYAVDGELAPVLPRELQEFGRPWYRMRALSVFPDNESLSASPHLWSSIHDARPPGPRWCRWH